MSNSNLHEALANMAKLLEENMYRAYNHDGIHVLGLMRLLQKLEIKGTPNYHKGFDGLKAAFGAMKLTK